MIVYNFNQTYFRHYYICVGTSPKVLRHGCLQAFNPETGTCHRKENVQGCEEKKETFEKEKESKRKATKKNVGLYDEFMEYLMKQGIFIGI